MSANQCNYFSNKLKAVLFADDMETQGTLINVNCVVKLIKRRLLKTNELKILQSNITDRDS